MPVLRKSVEKPFTKVIVSKGYGFHTPQDGSVCKIKVISDDANVLSGLDSENTKEIVVGDVDEYTERVIEDCIRTMKEEEECCVMFNHPDFNNEIFPVDNESLKNEGIKEVNAVDSIPNSSAPDSGNICCPATDVEAENMKESDELNDSSVAPDSTANINSAESSCIPSNTIESIPSNEVEIKIQLLSYTREPEIWEMSITEKWRRASYHKQRGLELYARGAYQYAFRRFGLTMKYVISLEHDVPSGQEEGMDIKGLKLSCYLNVAACQMRHHNFEAVVINSSKALAMQPKNAKALYRRGAAYLQLQEYEKAKEDLTEAQQLEPKNQAIAKQLQILKTQVQKLNQYYASAMKKMFS